LSILRPMSKNDVFAKRLAVIEEQKAARAEMDRLNAAIPLVVNSIKEMRLARLSDREIAILLRHTADELDIATPLAGN
jgi:hypothetical protein